MTSINQASKAWHSSPCPAMAASISGVSPSPLAGGKTERSLASGGNDGKNAWNRWKNMEKHGKRWKAYGKLWRNLRKSEHDGSSLVETNGNILGVFWRKKN